MSIEVSYQALTDDAARWDAIADSLQTMQSTVTGLDIHRSAFSFGGTGVADAYATVYAQVTQLVLDATTQTGGAADALRDVRDDFADLERGVKNDVADYWQAIE